MMMIIIIIIIIITIIGRILVGCLLRARTNHTEKKFSNYAKIFHIEQVTNVDVRRRE